MCGVVGLGVIVVVVVVGVRSGGVGGDGCSSCGWSLGAENFDGADRGGNDGDCHGVGCSGGVGIIEC